MGEEEKGNFMEVNCVTARHRKRTWREREREHRKETNIAKPECATHEVSLHYNHVCVCVPSFPNKNFP
jgi:hypothetical protein